MIVSRSRIAGIASVATRSKPASRNRWTQAKTIPSRATPDSSAAATMAGGVKAPCQ
jgi:hypothetical protein